jgi:drug/metabolite transporter (DMT)-like permease
MLTVNSHTRAALQALFVTFLWSTSWVLIKIGLQDDIPPLTFAGLRYTLAFVSLLPFVMYSPLRRLSVRGLCNRTWIELGALGLIFYAITQGAQFLGLAYLPAVTANLLLSFSTVAVALLGVLLLAERPTWAQWMGIALYLVGALVYFYPIAVPETEVLGVAIVLGGVLANAVGTILGRYVNRSADVSPLVVTVISMGIGSLMLLTIGILTQGLPALSLRSWAIIAWLALVNTAFAFTLWNHTQRTLSAMETSIINNAMMIQIPVLAVLFLNESVSKQKVAGMVLAGVGILAVQLLKRK